MSFTSRPELFEELVHPEDRALWAAHSELALRGDPAGELQLRIVTRTGQTRWIAKLRPIRGAHGEFLGVHASIATSPRCGGHAELERARKLFTGGPVVVFRWAAGPGWPCEYVSPNVSSLFGRSAEEFLSGATPFAEVIHPDDLSRVTAEITQFTQGGAECYEQEYRIVRPDGQVRWLRDFTVVRRDERGHIIHFDGYVLDVTGHKTAEEALQRRARFLSGLSAAAEHLLSSQASVPYQTFVDVLGPASGASRVYVFRHSRDEAGELHYSRVAEWCAAGVSRQSKSGLQNIRRRGCFGVTDRMAGGVVNCGFARSVSGRPGHHGIGGGSPAPATAADDRWRKRGLHRPGQLHRRPRLGAQRCGVPARGRHRPRSGHEASAGRGGAPRQRGKVPLDDGRHGGLVYICSLILRVE